MAQWKERELSSAHILVVGAGGGQEIITLGSRHEAWRFTGVDPSGPMLQTALRRMERSGLEQRVTLVQGELEQLALDQHYDAATCMLVLHFIKGLEQKKQLLKHIASRLHEGAPFFAAAINGEIHAASFSIQMQGWKSYMLSKGIKLQEWQKFENSIGVESDPIPASVMESLMLEAGFTQITRYYGAFLIDGWFAVKGSVKKS
ncbi:bifunctional 3-demethylubiquinone-9 3-methyltransferase/ 2-octaprenyl-6-hydroxy phenol methylase [compost metagenome]